LAAIGDDGVMGKIPATSVNAYEMYEAAALPSIVFITFAIKKFSFRFAEPLARLMYFVYSMDIVYTGLLYHMKGVLQHGSSQAGVDKNRR
jgi:hypothetical protein